MNTTDKEPTTSPVDSALARLREAGYKITNARRTVLEVLCQDDQHLTSADVIEQVEARDPSIGRASIFRTLELLTELAIIRPTYLTPRTPNYIVMPESGHHAHIICPQCSKITELGDCEIEDLIAQIAEKQGLEITGHLLEIYGICPDCSD
jgi:Fur family ferric uptake transcriptional regulator